jgi:hypothetical protein
VSMSKQNFIALADQIREHNRIEQNAMGVSAQLFTKEHLDTLADFCRSQNPQFMRDRWLGYIAGTNGKNGGAR